MLAHKILIGEGLRTVDGGAPRAVTMQEVPALDHKVFDHAVEFAAFVALRAVGGEGGFGFAGAELAEVFGGEGGDGGVEGDFDAPEGFT